MFMRYLYTECWSGSAETLQSLRDWMKCYRDLSTDLRFAEKMGSKDGDLTIVLTSPSSDSQKPAEGLCFLSNKYTV